MTLIYRSNKLSPATTEKLDHVYSNRKMAATVRDADELKMFAWKNEDFQDALRRKTLREMHTLH